MSFEEIVDNGCTVNRYTLITMMMSSGLMTCQPIRVICIKWYINLVWYEKGYNGKSY